MESAGTSSEITALKTKLRATWIAGDFGQIARFYTGEAEDFINRLNLKPGMKVLDTCAGEYRLASTFQAGAHVLKREEGHPRSRKSAGGRNNADRECNIDKSA